MPSAKSPAPGKPKPPAKNAPVEVVDPVWLFKAIGFSLAAALICGYATLCLLFYQGAWQLILHPTRTIEQTPAAAGLAYEDVHFGSTETGQPHLTAWWIPAVSSSEFQPEHAARTILYLHDGSGSLSNTIPALAALHRAGLNVFALDYRGFGKSDASVHPSEERMAQDTAAALEYLRSTRHIPSHNIIPDGVGLGASLAGNLARSHPEIPAVILDNPEPDPEVTILAQSSRFIPVRLLSGHPFDVAGSISTLAAPKLLIAGGPNSTHNIGGLDRLFKLAASPSFAVSLPSSGYDQDYQTVLSRFLDQYLPAER